MLQELARYSGSAAWSIASMLFFIAVYAVVAVRVARARAEDLRAHASLPLDDDPEAHHG